MVVDRIEGGVMVIEYEGGYIELPHTLNKEIKEGDLLSLEVDKEGTARRREELERKMEKLIRRS